MEGCVLFFLVPSFFFFPFHCNQSGLCEQHSKQNDRGATGRWGEELVRGYMMEPNTRTVWGNQIRKRHEKKRWSNKQGRVAQVRQTKK